MERSIFIWIFIIKITLESWHVYFFLTENVIKCCGMRVMWISFFLFFLKWIYSKYCWCWYNVIISFLYPQTIKNAVVQIACEFHSIWLTLNVVKRVQAVCEFHLITGSLRSQTLHIPSTASSQVSYINSICKCQEYQQMLNIIVQS